MANNGKSKFVGTRNKSTDDLGTPFYVLVSTMFYIVRSAQIKGYFAYCMDQKQKPILFNVYLRN